MAGQSANRDRLASFRRTKTSSQPASSQRLTFTTSTRVGTRTGSPDAIASWASIRSIGSLRSSVIKNKRVWNHHVAERSGDRIRTCAKPTPLPSYASTVGAVGFRAREFFRLYPLKWHYLARFGTLSKGLYLRKPYQATSYDKSRISQVHSARDNRSRRQFPVQSGTKWQVLGAVFVPLAMLVIDLEPAIRDNDE